MKSYTFIVNPVAGNGRAAKLIPMIKEELERERLPFELVLTTKAGNAIELARAARGEVVVAVGGDGTINEVANGLGSDKILGIIPAGSGNDLIKSLDIPKKPLMALRNLLEGTIVGIDVGTVECASGSEAGQRRIFTNGVGVGFDASVAIRKGEIPLLKGTAVYVLAVLDTLRTYEAPLFSVRTNGFPATSRHLLLAAIGNGKCAGGGFYLTPDADPSDGLLDVTLISDVRIRTILHLMPRVMRGKHMGHPAVEGLRTNHIVLESETPFNVHADGEIVGKDVTSTEVTLNGGRLRVISGKKIDRPEKVQ